jgi:hypothetical protein
MASPLAILRGITSLREKATLPDVPIVTRVFGDGIGISAIRELGLI